jgi:hypothetical protein
MERMAQDYLHSIESSDTEFSYVEFRHDESSIMVLFGWDQNHVMVHQNIIVAVERMDDGLRISLQTKYLDMDMPVCVTDVIYHAGKAALEFKMGDLPATILTTRESCDIFFAYMRPSLLLNMSRKGVVSYVDLQGTFRWEGDDNLDTLDIMLDVMRSCIPEPADYVVEDHIRFMCEAGIIPLMNREFSYKSVSGISSYSQNLPWRFS